MRKRNSIPSIASTSKNIRTQQRFELEKAIPFVQTLSTESLIVLKLIVYFHETKLFVINAAWLLILIQTKGFIFLNQLTEQIAMQTTTKEA